MGSHESTLLQSRGWITSPVLACKVIVYNTLNVNRGFFVGRGLINPC